MTDKPIRETDYERVMRAAKIKNITVMAYALLTTAAACALCAMAEWYR
ncbi:MAG: hypothetical protein AAB427_07445 [Chloroflexota bacterium]